MPTRISYCQFTVDCVTHKLPSIIGVIIGDILGPVLFLFFIEAVMTTWKNLTMDPFAFFSRNLILQ